MPEVSEASVEIGVQPTWAVAHLFPPQGFWTEIEYLALSTNRLVELSDGDLEVLPMPTELHQLISAFLYLRFNEFVANAGLGLVLFAPLKVRLWADKIREPDLVFMLAENAHRRGNKFWDGADLLLEIVSEDDPARDLVVKRVEYARAGIAEYWIVDPRHETITVLILNADEYEEHGVYRRGESATSVLLDGLKIDVNETFDRG